VSGRFNRPYHLSRHLFVEVRGFEPQILACHAPPLGSMPFTEVQEVQFCKAFHSCALIAVRRDSEYLLTETLTFD
jgi:hypothetical protein